MFYYLLTFLIGGTAYNIVLIVLSIIALIRAKKHKPYKAFFIFGIAITIFALLGAGLDGTMFSIDQLLYSLYTIILLLITIPKARKLYNESGDNSIKD